MRTAIINLGTVVTGDWRKPLLAEDSILLSEGKIERIGSLSTNQLDECDVVIDADGATAIPGLIDSQIHNTFGDYTPRQKTVGFLESYVHGGTTTAISASEVHVPGRPKDPEGVKALALAAKKCFDDYRPGGMRVLAGSMILEPGLTRADFEEVSSRGVWLVKAGFGAVETAYDYVPLVQHARDFGMISTLHTGGSSIPGSAGIWGDHVIAINPDVSFHVNGGPAAMPDADFPRVVEECQVALQVCTAGNLRTLLWVADLLKNSDQFDRLLVATDTPTGSGIMPLGMLYTISHLVSLGNIPAEWALAAATGNNARVYRLNSGFLQPGRDADVVILDACVGSSQSTALDALRNGDVPAVAAVITAGIPRFVGRSRNTPAPIKRVRVIQTRLKQDFSGSSH